MSDFQTGFEYLEGHTFVTDLNDPRVANETSTYLANATTKSCSLKQGDSFTFSCVKHDYMYGVVTFAFIFAPSVHVLWALMGPAIGGAVGALWGLVMFNVGYVPLLVGFHIKSVTVMLFGIFIVCLGIILLCIGLVGAVPSRNDGVKMIFHQRIRYIDWKGVKIYDFQKVTFSTLFKLYIAGLGVLIPKRYHMLG